VFGALVDSRRLVGPFKVVSLRVRVDRAGGCAEGIQCLWP
jgi:hypothetical protein